jgi:hypothetical protein
MLHPQSGFFEKTEADDDKGALALYFLLQEEICLNAATRQEEPLAIHKLMARHLSVISDYQVMMLNENDATRDIEACLENIKANFRNRQLKMADPFAAT